MIETLCILWYSYKKKRNKTRRRPSLPMECRWNLLIQHLDSRVDFPRGKSNKLPVYHNLRRKCTNPLPYSASGVALIQFRLASAERQLFPFLLHRMSNLLWKDWSWDKCNCVRCTLDGKKCGSRCVYVIIYFTRSTSPAFFCGIESIEIPHKILFFHVAHPAEWSANLA